ncbi:MAG: carboxypeptidase-like regulatory domain-containing protein [Bryobacteraceae bacterium]
MEQGWGRMRELSTRALLVTVVLSLPCGIVSAQSNQGAIAGNVQDPSGALVPGANVVAKGVGTGTTYQTVSSSAGSYVFSNVQIGNYDVTATAPGFKAAQVTDVVVQVGTTSSLNITLETGEVSQRRTAAPSFRIPETDIERRTGQNGPTVSASYDRPLSGASCP